MLNLRIPTIPKPVEEPSDPSPLESDAPRPTLSTPRFGRHLTTLSLSWMHGAFEAVAIHKGELAGQWEKADAGDDPARFGDWVKEAAARTGYRGSTVTLLLAHPRLSHQLVEVPPAKGSALRSLVERQVERTKVFDGVPAWAFQAAFPTKNSQSVLVHLVPRELLDRLVAETQRAGFHLVGVTPSAAVLHAQIGRLPLKPDEVAMVAADTGGMTTVVVGRTDGQLLLVRSLDGTRGREKGGLAVDMNRSLLFVSQQFGLGVAGVWWFGRGTAERLLELSGQIQIAAHPSAEEARPCYWAEEAARLTPLQAPNLISAEVRKAPQRRVALRVTVAVTLLLLALAGVTAGVCEVLVRRETASMRELDRRQGPLQARHAELQRIRLEMERRAQFSRVVLDDRPAPVPVWFLAYLSEAVPSDLVLTNLHVRRQEERWRVRLDGWMPSATNAALQSVARERIAEFVERLGSGPFRVSLAATGRETVEAGTLPPPRSTVEKIAVWAARPVPVGNAPSATGGNAFSIEGTLQ